MEAAVDPFTARDSDWNPSRYGWLSPRVSFSQGFVTIDRTSPEKRKRIDEVAKPECSSDFEFCMAKASLDPIPGASMSSADELFENGKLIPLLWLPGVGQEISQDKMKVEQQPWSMPQRFNLENPRCSSMSFDVARAGTRHSSTSLENSRCSSPSRFFSLPPTSPPSPKSGRHSGSRIKDFFKIGKFNAHSAETSPEPIESSNRRRTLSARYFWPFSRSNSAGERKTSPSPVLPCRSNSAGESKMTGSCLLALQSNADARQSKSNMSDHDSSVQLERTDSNDKNIKEAPYDSENPCDGTACRDSQVSPSVSETLSFENISGYLSSSMPSILPAFEITETGNYGVEKPINNKPVNSTNNTDVELRDAAKEILDLVSGLNSTKVKGIQRKPLVSPVRKFGKGSPGRRGGSNAILGKPVLRNLERCSARSRTLLGSQDVKSSEKQRSCSASVRVAPVLNVPTCIRPSMRAGKASKIKLLSLFGRKEKESDISFPVCSINKWRK